MKISLNVTILVGFVIEIFLFYIAGTIGAYGYPVSSMFYFILGLLMAWFTGSKIQEQAVEKYKKEHEN